MIPKPPSPPSARFAHSEKLMSCLPRTTMSVVSSRNGLPSSSLTDTSELEHTKVRIQTVDVKARLVKDILMFLRHENQPFPPSLSHAGNLRTGTKSELLQCFEEIALTSTQAPEVTCVILDGAAIVQMLKPGMAKNFWRICQKCLHLIFFTQYKSAH